MKQDPPPGMPAAGATNSVATRGPPRQCPPPKPRDFHRKDVARKEKRQRAYGIRPAHDMTRPGPPWGDMRYTHRDSLGRSCAHMISAACATNLAGQSADSDTSATENSYLKQPEQQSERDVVLGGKVWDEPELRG